MRRLEHLEEARRFRIAERQNISPTQLRRSLAGVMELSDSAFLDLRGATKKVDKISKVIRDLPGSAGILLDEAEDVLRSLRETQDMLFAFYTDVQEVRQKAGQKEESGYDSYAR